MSVRSAHIKSKLTSAVTIALLLCASSASQAQQKPEQLAQKSAELWLALVDSGKYAESWDAAAEFFKAPSRKTSGRAPWEQFAHRRAKFCRGHLRAPPIPRHCPMRPMEST